MSFRPDRLRDIREESGLSQRELAKLCGMDHVSIYRYEKSVTEPTLKILTVIAEKLNVSLDYLTGLTDRPRGQIGDRSLESDEAAILETYQQQGWTGILRLGAQHMEK